MAYPKHIGAYVLAIIVVMWISSPALGDESEHASHSEGTEHEFHRNHFGGLLGVSTHYDSDDSGPTIGLDYVRQLSKHFGLGAYVEMVSSRLERDVIVAVGGIYYPVPRLGLIVAPGIERVEKEVVHHDELETETEVEFLVRLGIGYGFPISATAAVGPIAMVDHAGDRWTSLFALGMVVGF